ncbi:glycosyltransferase family 4 protein [Bacillaceae bacterium OS4b]|nr:glycosyltransferase family 4 protein [Bacillaceae bacterium OS4b]
MKIALLSRYLPSGSKGGVGYQVHYLSNHLVKLGHEVTVYSMYEKPQDALYDVVKISINVYKKKFFRLFSFAHELRKQDFSNYDIVHSHGDDYLLSNLNIPILRTFHGSAIAEAMHSKTFKLFLRQLILYPIEFLSAVRCDYSVGVSRNTKKCIPLIKGIIPNGVDVQGFESCDIPKSFNPTILFVGTIEGRKRGELLVKHFNEVIKPVIPEAELWMVSDKEVNGKGIINFGKVNTEKLITLFKSSWIFCLPSSYEGFGVPYIEAMAAGSAVVATPNMGAKEILQDGYYGILTEEHALGNMIVKLIEEPELRNSLINKGKANVQSYNWDKISNKYLELYKNLIKNL